MSTDKDHPKPDSTESPASMGGRARAARLTPAERSAAARRAVAARWAKERGLPFATHYGNISIGDVSIPCAVLNDGRRVFTETGFQAGIGMSIGGAKDGLRPLARFATMMADRGRPIKSLAECAEDPIVFVLPTLGRPARGYLATVLADTCEAVLDARAAGSLNAPQMHIADRCERLMRGFARIGIIALVDEATGYQDDRARDELQRILAAYIVEPLRSYMPRFPHEFFRQVFRIHGWEYKEGQTRSPRYLGKFINRYVYDLLPPGVHERLRELSPVINGRRRNKLFQHLTPEVGEPHLDRQIAVITMLAKVSDNRQQYEVNIQKAFPKMGEQLLMDMRNESDDQG